MAFGRKKDEAEELVLDPTGWLLDSGIADVLVMNTAEIKYMCMLFYTFFHGTLVAILLFAKVLRWLLEGCVWYSLCSPNLVGHLNIQATSSSLRSPRMHPSPINLSACAFNARVVEL